MKQITIEIGSDGSVKIEGSGFVGKACDKAMAEIERALGVTKKRTNKGDYYRQETTQCQRT